MSRLSFSASPRPTVGVEIELALVDQRTMALTSAAPRLIESLPLALRQWIKPELMRCYVELNTVVCESVAEADRDLRDKLVLLERACDALGLALYWSGTHPFS